MKYKVGDEVRIKGTDIGGTIESIIRGQLIVETKGSKIPVWPEEVVLIEGLVEEETKPKFKVGDRVITNKGYVGKFEGWVSDYQVRVFFEESGDNVVIHPKNLKLMEKEIDINKWTGLKVELELSKSVIGVSNVESLRGERFMSGFVKAIIPPEDYIFKDDNGNVINAQKIVLEKKPDDKLKLESTKKVREYWSEYARIYIEIYEDEPNECVLTHLYTLEDYRQKGYGRQALIEAELIAKELGCHTAYLKVETDSWMHKWYLRMGYKWYKTANKEYTWLIKNLTSIEKKKKEYPKTYEECCKILDWNHRDYDRVGYKSELLCKLQVLILCRDAYWKIAGEEMGLGKPWELSIGTPIYYIYYNRTVGTIKNDYADDIQGNIILAFPTKEMRDAFNENFDQDLEICKELL